MFGSLLRARGVLGRALPAGRSAAVAAVGGAATEQARATFHRDLDAVITAGQGDDVPLSLALLGLDGVEALTTRSGRRWAERQVGAAAAALAGLAESDQRVLVHHTGVLTFAVVMPRVALDEAFELAVECWTAIVRDTDSIMVTIGLATLDPGRADDAVTLEIAADAALDQARSLGQPECGLVVAAAEAGTGLRWLAARSATSSSAAV